MKKWMYLMCSLLFLISCEPNSSVEDDGYEQLQRESVTAAEENQGEGEPFLINYKGEELYVQDFGEAYLFEGDILIPKNTDKSVYKSTSIDSAYWWKDNTIPYVLNSGVDSVKINHALDHWRQNTNLQFVKRTTETDYVYFTTGSGCSSYVGRIHGAQPITVSNSCSIGNIIHEIGHAAGLWHEHSRADRNEYVNILWDNIQSGREHNFERYTDMTWGSGYDLTAELDFRSVMMYGAYAFSANGNPTITKKDGSLYNVQRIALSDGDLEGINIMYPAENVNPDRDGDGIPNEEDECPDEAVQPVGEYNNNGCPWETGYHTFDNNMTVYRSAGKWYWYSRVKGWKQVKYSSYGYWYYV